MVTNEEIRDKIARHFGLGEYGVRLAQEYLDEYLHNHMENIRAQADFALRTGYHLLASDAADANDPYLTD